MTQPSGPKFVIRTLIGTKRDELATLERALDIVDPGGVTVVSSVPFKFAAAPAKAASKTKGKGKGRAARMETAEPIDGKLGDRVLEVLRKGRGPMKGKDVAAKIADYGVDAVIATLRSLAARKEVIRTGATLSLRYCAPEFTPDVAE